MLMLHFHLMTLNNNHPAMKNIMKIIYLKNYRYTIKFNNRMKIYYTSNIMATFPEAKHNNDDSK